MSFLSGRLHTAEAHSERGQKGSDRGRTRFFCSAFHCSLRAYSTRAGGRGRADRWSGASHLWAARARAGRALAALGLYIRARIDDDRLLLRDGALQHILRQIGHGGALRLQHVVGHIWLPRAGRDTRLENILGEVRHGRAGRAGTHRVRTLKSLVALHHGIRYQASE